LFQRSNRADIDIDVIAPGAAASPPAPAPPHLPARDRPFWQAQRRQCQNCVRNWAEWQDYVFVFISFSSRNVI
jgi:hypothetical protein